MNQGLTHRKIAYFLVVTGILLLLSSAVLAAIATHSPDGYIGFGIMSLLSGCLGAGALFLAGFFALVQKFSKP